MDFSVDSTSNNASTADLGALELELRKAGGVHECALHVHSTPNGEVCVAYIVTTGPFAADAANRKLRAGGLVRLPDAYVSLTRLPRDATGQVDRQALARVPVLEQASLEGLETALKAEDGVDQVAVYGDDSSIKVDPLPLGALPGGGLSSRRSAQRTRRTEIESAEIESAENAEAAPPEALPTGLPLAVCHGKPLDRGPNPPRTLGDTLVRAAERWEGEYLHFLDGSGGVRDVSFAALLREARSVAAGLSRHGVPVGSKVLLQLTEPAHIVPAFWGCVLGGWVPAISAVPTSYTDETSELDRLKHVWRLLDGPPFITSRALLSGMRHLALALGTDEDRLLAIEDLLSAPSEFVAPELNPNDAAFLVMTSGSTGMSKVIMLSHENILTRSLGTNELCRHERSDRILNWLPFDHIGSISDWHLRCVDLGCHMFYCTKEYVLGEPLNWLRLMDRFSITHSWAPNFAYALVNAALASSSEAFELSSVKALLTAGEAVSSSTVHDFLQRLAGHGLPKTAMRPAFGMAESGSGVTYFQPTPEQPVRLETIDRRTLDSAALRRVDRDDPQALSFPSLGPIIPGASMRVVDDNNQPVSEMAIGRLQIAGGPVCLGYYRNPEANKEVFVGEGWFNTGDRAFISQGELFLSGRDKETLIINGANFHNSEIEAAVEQVKGVRVSYTAACAVRPRGESLEKLALFVSPVACDRQQRQSVLREVQKSVAQRTGTKADYLIPVQPSEIPKTAIGKIQRKQLVKRFEAGEFAAAVVEADVLLENERTLPDWFLGTAWHPRAVATSARRPPGRLLVIGEGAGLSRVLASLVGGTRIVRDEAELAAAVAEPSAPFEAFIDLTTYGPEDKQPANGSHERAAHALSAACLALSARVQRCAGQSRSEASVTPRYLMVANASQDVLWSEALDPLRASLPAVLRALDQEVATLECGHVDLPLASTPAELENHARQLLTELAASELEPEVAYDQSSTRRVRGFERVTWAAAPAGGSRIQAGALYLVTGGLGGVGSELVQTLLTHFDAKVLVVGRTPLPAATEHNGSLPPKLEQLKKLEALGTVYYQSADVSDENALESAVSRVEAEFGQSLRGAFHLAGVYRERLLASESHEALCQALSPKVDGTRSLHEVVSRRGADAFVVGFSSLASIFSGSALGSYAAANRYQDAFAALERRRHQRPSFSFNWSVWKGLGIGADSAPADVLRSKGYLQVPGRSGMQALFAAIERQPGQLLIGVDPASPALRRLTNEPARPLMRARAAVSLKQVSDPAQRLQGLRQVKVLDRLGHAVSAEIWWLHRPPLDPSGALDRDAVQNEVRGADAVVQPLSSELEKKLGAIWKDVLSLDAVGANQSFFDLGGTSLLSVRLFSRIEKEFGVAFEPALLFKAATVGAMAKLLAESAAPHSQSEATSGARLFFIDDGAGDAARYRGLDAALKPALELCVLRPFGKERVPTLHTHVDDMLQHYAAKLRERAAEGPYAIAGRGVGAALALELGCLLQRAGESVPFLALIDPIFPDGSRSLGAALGLRQVLHPRADLRGGIEQAKQVLSRTATTLAQQVFDRGRFQLLRFYTDRRRDPPWFVEHLPLATVYGLAFGRRAPSQFKGRLHVFRTPEAQTLAGPWTLDCERHASDGVLLHDVGALVSNAPSAEAVLVLSTGVSTSLERATSPAP